MTAMRSLLQSTRPAFLLLTPICVLLGFSTAAVAQQPLNMMAGLLALVGALCAHASVNALNEYQDFRSGLDLATTKTPFSGGSNTLPAHPQLAHSVLWLGVLTLIVTVAIGLYLLAHSDYRLLLIGIIGVALVVAYTPWINHHPWLCLVAPGCGFGLLMVTGTHLILTGAHSALPWQVALVPFFLVNNLLLLNQYPDITADKSVGRRTFPIVYGLRASNVAYGLFALLAYSVIVYLIAQAQLPVISALALVPAALSAYALRGAIVCGEKIGQYPQYLAANVAAALLTPLLLALTIFTPFLQQ